MTLRTWGIALICALGLTAGLAAQTPPPADDDNARVIRLTSLEWPPYTSQILPEQGAATAVVRAALAAMGYRLQVDFYPWSRAVALVKYPSNFVGYFPEYLSPQVARDCLLSDPFGSGPLGFAERAGAPVNWARLEDLSGYRIGVVQDYVNADDFDRRVREKTQAVDLARNDAHNLLKLAADRVSLAVIDRRVFEYLLRNDARVSAIAPQLHFNGRLIEDKQLYICFRRGPEGEVAQKILNAGLKKIDTGAVMNAALR